MGWRHGKDRDRYSDLIAIAESAIAAVNAGTLIERALAAPPPRFDPDRPTTLIAAGKAAASMATAYLRVCGSVCRHGLVVGTPGAVTFPEGIASFQAGHPVPNAASVEAGGLALRLARETPPGSQLVVLLSGGASAAMAVPQVGLTLEDKQHTTSALLVSGADIHELNCVRKHLSAVKGGRLAAACRASTFTFALSDVVTPVDDDPSVIGSGPTVADPSTYEDALSIIDRLGVAESLPMAALALLERGTRGEIDETPKPGDARLSGGAYVIAGNRKTAMSAARLEAERRGYHVQVEEAAVTGEARGAGSDLLARALAQARRGQPSCLIASGETVVRVTGSGKGGRNQELVLGALPAIAEAPRAVFFASIASDGIDGPTEAAGAWVGPETSARARAAGLDAAAALRTNDSYNFFDPLGNLIRTGPTGTNVGDLQIVIVV